MSEIQATGSRTPKLDDVVEPDLSDIPAIRTEKATPAPKQEQAASPAVSPATAPATVTQPVVKAAEQPAAHPRHPMKIRQATKPNSHTANTHPVVATPANATANTAATSPTGTADHPATATGSQAAKQAPTSKQLIATPATAHQISKPANQAANQPELDKTTPSSGGKTASGTSSNTAAANAESPAVHHGKPGFFSSLGSNFGWEKQIKPVSYTPLPAIAIFPVIKHGREKAFGDLPLMFAREYAERMELKAPETRVYHPIYSVDELRIRGLGHIYDQIMDYYVKAGRPEPAAMDYLLKQFASDGKPIARVIFVEADLDMSHPDAATGAWERANQWLTDATPKQMKYFVHSRLQVYDAEEPSFPMVWSGSWSRSIKTNQFGNVTPSVFADSDSQQSFARLSRQMSRELLFVTPKSVYMAPQYDLGVQGKLASDKEQSFPNLTEMQPAGKPISDENKAAIQRILQRQNALSP